MSGKAHIDTWRVMADAIRAAGMQSFALVAVGPDGHVYGGADFGVMPEEFPRRLREQAHNIEAYIKREAERAKEAPQPKSKRARKAVAA